MSVRSSIWFSVEFIEPPTSWQLWHRTMRFGLRRRTRERRSVLIRTASECMRVQYCSQLLQTRPASVWTHLPVVTISHTNTHKYANTHTHMRSCSRAHARNDNRLLGGRARARNYCILYDTPVIVLCGCVWCAVGTPINPSTSWWLLARVRPVRCHVCVCTCMNASARTRDYDCE